MDTPLDRLTEQFRRLPGIGIKTARKLAYYMVQQPEESVNAFIGAIRDAKSQMHFCSVCFNLSSTDPCPICSDPRRDHSIICVVETPQDVLAIERSGAITAFTMSCTVHCRPSTGWGSMICGSKNSCSACRIQKSRKSSWQRIRT